MSSKFDVFSSNSEKWTVPRTALVQKMKRASGKKNIYLTAPGGYGKSVAAAQWLSSVQGKSAWMLAGDADNNPGVFYKRLATSLLKLAGKEKGIPDTTVSFDRLLETIRLLPEKSARRYFVLDDLHVIKNEEILHNMPHIATRLPGYIRRCLVSRSEPTAAFMETGLFELITKDDLLFSPEEVEWLGAVKDRSLTARQITDLLETTGGWAMYVSALLSDGKGPDTAGKNKAPQTLTQYLRSRVWELWDRETKVLLLDLAVPAAVTPSLAERLTGRRDGRGVLERLAKRENAFLSLEGVDTYRFHDIFRDFLLGRMDDFLGEDEIRRLNGIAAGWYYEQGDYYAGARHYIHNGDHEGINHCMEATNRFHAGSGNISVEARLDFIKQYVMSLSREFISESPYLLSKCAVVAFHDGNAADFIKYADLLNQKMPEISADYPELIENVGFVGSLDFRVPLIRFIEMVAKSMPLKQREGSFRNAAKSATVTQNLPFYHRSMRDHSEYYELNEEDFKLARATFGVMIGNDFVSMEKSIVAGIYYERGELLQAAGHALEACRACDDDAHPETIFSANMILAATLYAMGASREADGIMERTGDFIERKARCLHPNFKALQTERAIRRGNTEAAREWLTVHASALGRLPFYQICRHFATLRSYIAVKEHAAAAAFGMRLQLLALEYKRPLDHIESGLLTAVALWLEGEKNNAVKQLEQAAHVAEPYGFTQLFINEGKELLPLLWELRKHTDKPDRFARFTDRLVDDIYKKHNLKPADEKMPGLSERQLAMLQYLSQGMSYNEIADAAALGRGTVKSHVLLAYKRLGVRSAQEAVVKAKMLGLLE